MMLLSSCCVLSEYTFILDQRVVAVSKGIDLQVLNWKIHAEKISFSLSPSNVQCETNKIKKGQPNQVLFHLKFTMIPNS